MWDLREPDCRVIVELVTEYLEGALAPDPCDAFERHLALCPGCDAYLDQMRRAISLTSRLAGEDVDPEVLAGLLAAFRSRRR
ncbi:MAG TPA: zf-HC2 domain-containing protein [Acidimicrobiia bacterium]|nr:zf-HC2 domain-containing protein [Acidimicrobiia bacterium]